MNNEFITIESHFGLILKGSSENHSIRAITRNRCAQDLVDMLLKVAFILYPDEEFEIYFLPSEPGSFKDILKFTKKHPIKTSAGIVATIATVTIGYLTYKDNHETHEHDKQNWILEDVGKCLDLEKEKADLEENYNIENFPQEKIDAVCNNLDLQRKKNDRYQTLKDDSDIISDQVTLKTDSGKVLITKSVSRDKFSEYIKPITIEEGFINIEARGIIELLGPVVRQLREGGGIKWKGIYHGDDIEYKGDIIFAEGNPIDFYMQDDEFKERISAQDIVFKFGDNMAVEMNITFFLSDKKLNRKKVYVNRVVRFNEDEIEHKIKTVKRKTESIESENQLSLL